MHTREELRERQALPLNIKILMTQHRIREWVNYYGEDGVYISFSGGKDSTVLLDLVRDRYPNVPAVFVDIPTQYPELREFVKTFDNTIILKPKINFFKVCEKYGFPIFGKEIAECVEMSRKYLTAVNARQNALTDRQTVKGYWAFADLVGMSRRGKAKETEKYKNLKQGIIPSEVLENAPARTKQLLGQYPHREKGKETGEYSNMYDRSQYKFMLNAPFEISNMCCKVMKKQPVHSFSKQSKRVPMTAQMAEESRLRTSAWLKNGCNAFESKNPISNPMSFWTEQDVLEYIRQKDLKICSVYGDVLTDDEEMGQITWSECGIQGFDEKQPYHCTGCQRTGCVLCGFGAHMPDDERFLLLKETHPKMYQFLDVAQNSGYTMRQAIEWINENSNKYIKL